MKILQRWLNSSLLLLECVELHHLLLECVELHHRGGVFR